uniref:hypothetical protein n=1 Tax=Klebsiella pneumoniae TaxID=573 RepID=UPI001C6F6C87
MDSTFCSSVTGMLQKTHLMVGCCFAFCGGFRHRQLPQESLKHRFTKAINHGFHLPAHDFLKHPISSEMARLWPV